MRDQDDNTLYYQGFVIDISEKKSFEKKQQDAFSLAQSVLDGLSDNIALLDERGIIIFVSQAWKDFAEENDVTPDMAQPLDRCIRKKSPSRFSSTNISA